MKKLLLFLALAAGTLTGWADEPSDYLAIIGGATKAGWPNSPSAENRSVGQMVKTGDHTWVWVGKLTTGSEDAGNFKFSWTTNGWDGYWANSDDLSVGDIDTKTYTLSTNGSGDVKYHVNSTGIYRITIYDTNSTPKMKVEKLAQPPMDNNYYQIETVDQFMWFVGNATSDGATSKAKLTADIDFTGKDYFPIGCETYKFQGEIDGGGHCITLAINSKSNYQGLVGHATGGVTIKNLILKGSVTSTGSKTAGFIAETKGGGDVTITNCGNEATITGGAGETAAFIANNNGSSACTLYLTNAYNTGNVTGTGDVSTISAYAAWSTFTNVYNSGDVTGAGHGKFVRNFDGASTYNNCYSTVKSLSDDASVNEITSEQVSSGELCFLLNGSSQGGTNWYHNLIRDADTHPVPINTHRPIYKNGDDYSNLLLTDGKYQIGSYDDLKDFSKLVASGSTSLNAKLTANITADNTYTPIGTTVDETDYKYAGEFDGNQKTVTLATSNGYSNQGLFGIITGGANIHDLIVGGSVQGLAKVAGVVGLANGGGVVTLTNVINRATVRSTGNDLANAAGIVGCAANSTAVIYTNCANMGDVSGQDGQCSGIAGWTDGYNGTKTLFVNCWNSGRINNMENNCNLYRNTSKVDAINCYDVSGQGSYTQGTQLANTTLTSGELCYKLNGDQQEFAWYQNLSSDTYPVPFSSHSEVYPNAEVKCDGSSVSGSALTYTNENTYSVPEHTYSNGWCSVCNAYQENAITPDGEGWYCISQPWQLRWLAESVNKHYNDYRSANIKLTGDIDYSAYQDEAAMFGWEYHTYKGTFDGQCHAVTVDFEASESETGLFRRVNGGTIKNLKVDGKITTNSQFAGGIVAGIWETGVITNCVSAVKLKDNSASDDGTHGGILGWVNSVSDITVSNCLFIGEIDAPNRTGCTGVVGWTADNTAVKVKNCLVGGTLKLKNDGANGIISRSTATYNDNHYICSLSGDHDKIKTKDGTDASAYNTTPGELCLYLNGNTPYNAVWRQNLVTDADATPIPFNTHGIVNKISSVGYTTQYIDNANVTIPDNVEAFAGKVNNLTGNLTLVPIEDAIPQGEAVILRGEAGYYSFVPTESADAVDNDLSGSDGDVNGGANIYALSNLGGEAEIGFYPTGDYKIPAGKAYLAITEPGGGNVKGFTFVFEDTEDGIKTLSNSPLKGENIYNLAGQRIQKMQKGINIVNGKKIMK